MKILVCASEYPPHASGIGNVAERMVNEFKKRGHVCTVCSPTGPDIALGSYRLIKRFGGLGVLYFWWRVSRHFAGKAGQWDAVWLHWPILLASCPFSTAVATYHGTYKGFHGMVRDTGGPLPLRVYYALMERAERRSLPRLGGDGFRFTAVGKQTVTELNGLGIRRDRITYVPVGVDTELFRPAPEKARLRARFGIDPESLVFLFVGRLTRPKNLFRLVDTFAAFRARNGMAQAVLLVAGGGELSRSLAVYIRRHKIGGVRLLGFVPNRELPDVYGCADYFVMASTYEGQPVALLEAMASGLPPIVSGIPSVRQFVEESGAGLVVGFSDPDQAASSIRDYVTGPKGQRDRATARRHVEDAMSSSACADKYLDLLAEVGSQQGSGGGE